ncbi:hypothetical protein, partial [Fulvivirga kasyanovii]
MILKGLILLVLISFNSVLSFSQNKGKPFVQNYGRSDYKASISNFDILQDKNQLIYVANYDGVIVHDGSNWQLVPINNNTVAVSIAQGNNNRIYVGSDKDFGYLASNELGELRFRSLLDKIPYKPKFSIVRKIINHKNKTYFFSSEEIFVFEDKKFMHSIKAGASPFLFSLFPVNDKIYTVQSKKGLITLKDSIIDIDIPTRKLGAVTYMTTLQDSLSLVGTHSQGLYELTNKSIIRIKNESSDFLAKNKLFDAEKVHLSDSLSLIMGTSENGVLLLNKDLKITANVNKNSGLQSETIKKLTIDSHFGVWTAMQEGVSHLELYSPWTYWDQLKGLEGTP